MKPGGIFQDLPPVEHSFFHFGNGGVCPVVHHFGGTGHGAGFEEIDPHAFPATENPGCSHIIFPEIGDAPFGDIIIGKPCHKIHGDAVVCQRDGYIRLTTPEGSGKIVGLNESLIARCGQTQHDLTKSNNFLHISRL